MAPRSEYLFRLDQPARKMPSGLKLETATRYTRPDGRSTGAIPTANGMTAITMNADMMISTGAAR